MDQPKDSAVHFTKLPIVEVPGGDVFHCLKKNESEFIGFGEAYFSSIQHNKIKAWKKHKSMTMNLFVPVGKVKFVFQNRENSFTEFVIGEENYGRITVKPEIWFGFKGISKGLSIILNISNIMHDPKEVDKVNMLDINYNWNK